MTDRWEAGQDVWNHRGPLEEPWLQVSNLSFFFVASVNAHNWVSDKLSYQMVGRHSRRDVRIVLPNAASFFAQTSKRCLTMANRLDQWFLTFVTGMFLNYNSQKPQPAQLVVKASGSCSPKLLSNPRLRTSGLDQVAAQQMCNSSIPWWRAVEVDNALAEWAFKCSGGVLLENS